MRQRWARRCARVALVLSVLALATPSPGDPLAIVNPVPPPTYPVGCSNVEQDFSRLQPGETAEQYWDGFPSGSQERYVSQLLVNPAAAMEVALPIPGDTALFVDRAGTQVTYDFLVCYPTTPTNPNPDYLLPTGDTVPHMQVGTGPPVWPDATTRWPVLLFSHGLAGSPLDDVYLRVITALAGYGFVIVAPFHGDPRFADVQIQNIVDLVYAVVHFPTYVEMQAIRPLSSAAALDLLLSNTQFQDHIDATRIAGFGASLGGETLLLQVGAQLTDSIGLSSKQVLADTRLKAIFGYVPYFGQPIYPAFGRDQGGLDGITVAFLGMSGTADTIAPVGPALQGVEHLAGARYLVTLQGVTHQFDVAGAEDIFTWALTFVDAYDLDDRVARVTLARMTHVADGAVDQLVFDYTAPAVPYLAGESDVVEYEHDATGHYFITANPAETTSLDAGGVWQRTGFEFKAFALDSGSGAAACRFFSAPALSPDSHFFTIDPNECAVVKASPLWLYEGLAFDAQPPLADGTCALDRVPVFRLYNNGMGGQPNHRFLTSKSETAAMQAQGWVLEGTVFCAPP